MAKSKTYVAKSLRGVALGLTVALGLVAAALIGFAALETVWLLKARALDPGQFMRLEDITDEAGSIQAFLLYAGRIVCLLLAIPFAMFFTYRATANSHVFARGVSSGAGMAVFWWIIPFAALFKPYQVISEAWRVGRDPDRWRSLHGPLVLRIWWGLHLLSIPLTYGASITAERADTAGGIVTALMVEGVGFVIQAIATLLFIGIVNAIARRHAPHVAAGRTRAEAAGPGWAT